MAYEIDFIGTNKVEKDYDATSFRFKSGSRFVNCVFDGGTAEAGEALVEHLKAYYSLSEGIDYVFCSHPDLDHASGLTKVLESLKVKVLVMNRPWDYLDELYEKVKDGRITKESLERTLREKYKYVNDLEKIAQEKGVTIKAGVQGTRLGTEMTVMSPSKDFYIECVASSEKTPDMDAAAKATAFNKAFQQFKAWIAAIWGIDAIKDGETTSADNESSIVLYVKPEGNKPFLFTGDAGCDALTRALDYGEAIEMPLADCHFVQMPHHGGRHNVGPTVLNRLLGDKVEKDSSPTKVSFVSVGKNSDHPRKCVVNAFITRGCTVYVCSTNTLCHHEGEVPPRNWGSATPEKFSTQVEE